MRLAVLGNSGSGKSTLARWAAELFDATHLDLDEVAWCAGDPPARRPLEEARRPVEAFCGAHERWVVEGCYGDLVGVALGFGPRLVFLNPGAEVCVENCRARPFEPHKYATREAQDANLARLVEWVRDYERRDGDLSLAGHRALYDGYRGPKLELRARPLLDAELAAALR